MLWGVVRGPLHIGHLPYTSLYMGVPPLQFTPPLSCWLPCALACLGISVCYMGNISLILGVWGVLHLLGVLGASAHGVSICLFLYILVVHYVSHFYYGYDYSFSSYSGVFLAVICFIIDCGSFHDGVSCNINQHGMVQPPPLMQRGSGGVIGPTSVPQQQPPSLMPLLPYANFVMGSPQVGFFFRFEPPTILYIICLLSVLVSAFYF